MTFWRPKKIDGCTYDPAHLHPITIKYVQPEKGDKPERTYTVEIHFGLHCFTRGAKPEEKIDPKSGYSDAKETRIFDLARFELSKRLPELVKNLATTKCYHTNHGNFFIVETINEGGKKQQYEVYFTLSRSSKKGVLNLFVQSAYIRDEAHQSKSRKKPIGFFILLYNVQNNKPIRPPPK